MREMFNFRYYVLAFLVWAAMVGWLSDAPEYMDNVEWLQYHLGAKGVGTLCGYVAYRLVDHWNFLGRIPLVTKVADWLSGIVDGDS